MAYGDKSELKVSLHTTDRTEAAQRVREKALELHDEFAQRRAQTARAAGHEKMRRVTHVNQVWADRFCTRILRTFLAGDKERRRERLSSAELAELIKETDETAQSLRDAYARRDIEVAKSVLVPMLHLSGFELDCDKESYMRLAQTCLAMLMRHAQLMQRRNSGEIVEVDEVAPETKALALCPTLENCECVCRRGVSSIRSVPKRSGRTSASIRSRPAGHRAPTSRATTKKRASHRLG